MISKLDIVMRFFFLLVSGYDRCFFFCFAAYLALFLLRKPSACCLATLGMQRSKKTKAWLI
jgi:hypothetical protein